MGDRCGDGRDDRLGGDDGGGNGGDNGDGGDGGMGIRIACGSLVTGRGNGIFSCEEPCEGSMIESLY